ncbi:MAG: sugar phosphate isomerase/epimerase [Gordonia sp. (in: high G+C Gram-positive bacteria)]|uniref:sugar phosphate isomerase/epimerase family protein n=1 Tax=Gordonia sp. (in: high G+C Gram-positive bacteria) TaxID=84139 RepID=UPI0039E34FB6
MSDSPFDLIATCWTSAGDVVPLAESEVSPVDVLERIAAIGATGWSGLGLAQDDLRHIADGIGFPAVRAAIDAAGLRSVDVELLGDWWETGRARAASDRVRSLLFAAADGLRAGTMKIGTAFGAPLDSIDPLVAPLRDLADEAAEHRLRLTLEPMPFSMISSIPLGADLVRAVDRPNCGVIVDAWHVFRADTSLPDLRACLSSDILFGVELNDADADPVGTLFEDTRDRRRLCGRGAFDLIGLIRTLADVGWTGPWGVEILSDEHRAEDVTVALTDARDTALEVLAAALS